MRTQVARDRWFVAIALMCMVFTIVPSTIQSFTAVKYRVSAGQAAIPETHLAHRVDEFSVLIILALCVVVLALGAASISGRHRATVVLLSSATFRLE